MELHLRSRTRVEETSSRGLRNRDQNHKGTVWAKICWKDQHEPGTVVSYVVTGNRSPSLQPSQPGRNTGESDRPTWPLGAAVVVPESLNPWLND